MVDQKRATLREYLQMGYIDSGAKAVSHLQEKLAEDASNALTWTDSTFVAVERAKVARDVLRRMDNGDSVELIAGSMTEEVLLMASTPMSGAAGAAGLSKLCHLSAMAEIARVVRAMGNSGGGE